MVEITVDHSTAQIEDGTWTSDGELLLLQCECFTTMHPWNAVPSNPDPDYDVAKYVARELGGKITKADEIESVPGRIY